MRRPEKESINMEARVSVITPEPSDPRVLIEFNISGGWQNPDSYPLTLDEAQCWVEEHRRRVDNSIFNAEGDVQIMDSLYWIPPHGVNSILSLNAQIEEGIKKATE